MFGAIPSQQLFSASMSQLRTPYPSARPAPVAPPATSLAPWLIGGVLLGVTLHLLFRD